MQVLPYELKGKLIREISIITIEDAIIVKEMFLQENDKWLKKMLAIKLLEFEKFDLLKIDKSELLKSTQCKIDL